MKNTIKLLVLLTFLTASVHVNALESKKEKEITTITKNTPDDLVIREKNEKVSVILSNPNLNSVNITIADSSGRVVFSEIINDNTTIHKSFNFKNAFKGNYDIKVKNGVTTYSKKIEII